jgi:hypothetical protein
MSALDAAVSKLAQAVAFYDQCLADKSSTETGAMRDAFEWLRDEARAVAKFHDAR